MSKQKSPPNNLTVSRRLLLTRGATAAVATGMTSMLGSSVVAEQIASTPEVKRSTKTGRKFRAFVRDKYGASVKELKLLSLDDHRVLVRMEASQCCYTITGQALGSDPYDPPRILGHGGVGVVEEIGARVRRVQVGDHVIIANTPQCGECYMCLHGRADRCQMLAPYGNFLTTVAELADGTPVVQHDNIGGLAELAVPYEWFCIPVFTNVSATELSILACPGACGLGTVFGIAPVEPGSDVVVLGCGPLGLSAVQGARIKGAAQIIAVEPIKYRRDVALKVGATMALDPNHERNGLVSRIRELCKGPTDRRFAGGRDWGQGQGVVNSDLVAGVWCARGPDFVIEAVGGDQFPPKAGAGPDPTGILPLQQAWEMCSAAGHVTTVSVSQIGNFSLRARDWSNGDKNHHPGNMNGVATLRDMPRFVRLIEAGLYDAKSLATATYSLDQTLTAFQAVADRTTVAAIIVFS